jgi:4-hydroxy-3-methylbut-2-en-1-yl diphosphate reductase
MKTFNVPEFYRSPIISKVKQYRKLQDPRKKDNSPTMLDFGDVQFLIARHFGFCYGVENAIEISFKALEENPNKRIFLLSQMIHNPDVNRDLVSRGVQFLQDTEGNQLIPFDEVSSNDVVIIPAFGAPLDIIDLLHSKHIQTETYNTTCPFVERVWKKSESIGKDNYTIIIHGKHNHEETKATFSRSDKHNKALVVRDLKEAKILGDFILGKNSKDEFERVFKNKCSASLNTDVDFNRVGVINQTTMLASETQEIADYFKSVMIEKYGLTDIQNHFADTRDTLCYATNENQDATMGLLNSEADLAIVVGGYNSSNTSHLVELCERKFKTYFISSEQEIIDQHTIQHFDYPNKKHLTTSHYLPNKKPVRIILTSGASCPDSVIEGVIHKINSFYSHIINTEDVLKHMAQTSN